MKSMKRSRKSERTLNSCMRHGDDHRMGMRRKRKHLEPMCDVQGMSVTTAKQRLTTKTATLRACSRVHQVF